MNIKTVLVIGGRGFLGSRVVKDKPKDINLWYTVTDKGKDVGPKSIQFNLLEPDRLVEIIEKINSGVIIHCARLDPFDNNPEKAAEITKKIVEAVNKSAALLLYISSDAVFDGKRGNYKEDDRKIPKTDYGEAKLASEKVIQNSCKKYIIVRTANIYGRKDSKWDDRTAAILSELKSENTINRYKDSYRSFTLVDDLSKSIWKLVKSDFNGVINISGPRKSFFEQSRELATKAGINPDRIKGISFKEENPDIAQDTSLDNSLAKSKSFI